MAEGGKRRIRGTALAPRLRLLLGGRERLPTAADGRDGSAGRKTMPRVR